MPRTLRALALAALLFSPACKKAPPEPMVDAPQGTPDGYEVGGVEGGVVGGVVGPTYEPLIVADYVPTEVEVKLLDAGAEPRQQLRFTAEKGQTEVMRMTMNMSMEMEMMGMPMEIVVPAMILDMEMAVLDVDPSGNILYTAEVIEVGLGEGDPGMVAALQSELSALEGLKGEMLMSPTGLSLRAGFSAPEGASPEILKQVDSINQSTQNMSVPMPTEAVGPGAKWTVLRTNSANGLSVVERSEVELTALDGDAAELHTTVSQLLATADPVLEGMPPGAEVQILAFDSKGETTAAIRMDELVPSKSTGQVRMDMRMRITAEGQTQDMGMGMDLGVEMGPRP